MVSTEYYYYYYYYYHDYQYQYYAVSNLAVRKRRVEVMEA
jgi:hypothetical protein